MIQTDKNYILQPELIRCHYDIKIYKIFQKQKQLNNKYIYFFSYCYIKISKFIKNIIAININTEKISFNSYLILQNIW